MKRIGSLMTAALMLGVLLVPVCSLKVNATVYRPSPQRTVVDELPDANAPDAPAVVTVQEDDGPTTYVRTEDPENPENFEYIPEDEVPLADAEGLGENTPADNTPAENAGENPGGEDPAAVAVATPAAGNPVKTVLIVGGGILAVGAVGGGIAVATGVIGAGAAGASGAGGAGAASGKGFFSRLLNLFKKGGRR